MAAENWQLRHGITKSIAYLPQGPPIAVWTKLQVPRTKTLDANYWNTIFQPLVHTIGHHETVWARVPGNPDVVLLATLWWTTSEMREFQVSPSSQLYREILQCEDIIPISTHETIYGFAYWFHFESQASELVGIRPPAFGPGVPLKEHFQTHLPVLQWTTETEALHGKQVHLLLWPHFWRDKEKVEYRHGPYAQKRFTERLYEFTEILKL
ncbi:hypothetical protein BJX66DRAFT_328254 [Aspergillus keveii]|uniref:ABM domain-containing protein n=1 Tax=Aspergillus keveii TaxID=714993 RepID=A0ABR4FUI2_9EURO